jgi:cytochrome P450
MDSRTSSTCPDFEAELCSRAFFRDPYPVYERLRAVAPVYWSESWQSWILTRFEDCDSVLRDAARFSNADRFAQILDVLPELAHRDTAILDQHVRLGVANADRPEHTRLRSLMQQGFHPRDVAPMADHVAAVVTDLLNAVDRRGFDLVEALARPLPAIVISEMLGIPPEDRHRFKALIDATQFHGAGTDLGERARAAVDALGLLEAWLTPMIVGRRAQPRDDILSRLVAATERGDILDDAELVATCIILVRAGQVTTEGLIGNGMLALLRHREQWEAIVAYPSLVPQAVEEMFRYDTSFLRTLRRVTDDVEFGGAQLKQGELVSVMLGAANHDPERYEQPHVFDIGRTPARHLGLGVASHFCLGAPLARLEAQTAIAAVAARWPALDLAPAEPDWHRDNVMRSLRQLLVAG